MKLPIKKLKIRLMISFVKKAGCPLAGFFLKTNYFIKIFIILTNNICAFFYVFKINRIY